MSRFILPPSVCLKDARDMADLERRGEMTREQIKRLQEHMLALGASLPRWGADGILGNETLRAVGGLLEHTDPPLDLWPEAYAEVMALQPSQPPDFGWDDLTQVADYREHAYAGRAVSIRPAAAIDTVVLHQTACVNYRGPQRWTGMDCHWVIEREDATAYLLHHPWWRMWHAHGFNRRSVGIEVEGLFSGIGMEDRYFWHPPSWTKGPMDLPEAQAEAAREAVLASMRMVEAIGGQVRYIGAHRQSHGRKSGDPGSLIWQEVGVWAQEHLGLEEAPTLRGGLPIPEAWDPRNKGVEY